MQVHELAKQVGAESKELTSFLGKGSHMERVTEEDVTKAEEKYGKASKATVTKKGTSVRLWSMIKNITFTTEYGAIYLREWKLDVEEGGKAHVALKKHTGSRLMQVVDKPFEDTIQRTVFADFLSDKAYTGRDSEPALRDGYGFLMALFTLDEIDTVATLMEKGGMKAVIQYAVENKSYINI